MGWKPEICRRRGSTARAAIVAIGLVGALAGIGYLTWRAFLVDPTQVVVRNLTGRMLSLVEIRLDYYGAGVTTERFGDFADGEEYVIRPARYQFSARLMVVVGGRERVHSETVDLWRGEAYIFDILPDGTVRSTHVVPPAPAEGAGSGGGE